MKLDGYALGVAPRKRKELDHTLHKKEKKNPQMKHFFLNLVCSAGYWDTDFVELLSFK